MLTICPDLAARICGSMAISIRWMPRTLVSKIAFVAFMAGPIAARLLGPGPSLLLPAGLVGALLVLVADLVGQWAFESRYPVGVITGILGAPYLVYLLVRTHRSGGSL